MRRINMLFLRGCGYAILILTLFYIFAALSSFVSLAIGPLQFALITGFGFIISLAELIYEELKLKRICKALIHYGVLLIAFCVIFIISGNISSQRPSAIFAAIIIFTVLYFALYVLIHFTKKAINAADNKLDTSTKRKNVTKKEEPYKSIYSDGGK